MHAIPVHIARVRGRDLTESKIDKVHTEKQAYFFLRTVCSSWFSCWNDADRRVVAHVVRASDRRTPVCPVPTRCCCTAAAAGAACRRILPPTSSPSPLQRYSIFLLVAHHRLLLWQDIHARTLLLICSQWITRFAAMLLSNRTICTISRWLMHYKIRTAKKRLR